MNFKLIVISILAASVMGCYGDKASKAVISYDITNNEEPAVAYGDAEARVLKSRNEIAGLLLEQTNSNLITYCSQVRLPDCEKHSLESGFKLGRAYYLLVNRANNAAKLAPDISTYQNFVEISNGARKEVLSIQRDLKSSADSQDIITYSLENYIVRSCFAKEFNKRKQSANQNTWLDEKQMSLSQEECIKNYETSYRGLESLNSEYFDGLNAIFHIAQNGNSIDLTETPLSYLSSSNLATYKNILAQLGNNYLQARSKLNMEKLLEQRMTDLARDVSSRFSNVAQCLYGCSELRFDSTKSLVKWEVQLEKELSKIKNEADRLMTEKKKFPEVNLTVEVLDSGVSYSLYIAKLGDSNRLYFYRFDEVLKALKSL